MSITEIAEALREAFEEGFDSYATPCSPYNSAGEAWLESQAKVLHDRLLGIEPEPEPEPEVRIKYPCPHCNKKLKTPMGLKQHIEMKHS